MKFLEAKFSKACYCFSILGTLRSVPPNDVLIQEKSPSPHSWDVKLYMTLFKLFRHKFEKISYKILNMDANKHSQNLTLYKLLLDKLDVCVAVHH